jgi:AcrR family transcriptional regulator
MSREEVVADQRRRILDGLALALVHHGYEGTKITDIVELAGVSRPTFYERFESKDACFEAAYRDGVERLAEAIAVAGKTALDRGERLAAGLAAGLDFLAANPTWAHLLLVESLAAPRPARLEHERALDRLAESLRAVLGPVPGLPPETPRLLAGSLASHLSGRVLAGEAEQLTDSRELLLAFLLAPAQVAAPRETAARRALAG